MASGQIHDQVPGTCQDMGLTTPDLVRLTKDYETSMAALRNATLAAGKFAWQMLWTGGTDTSIGGTGLGPLVSQGSCAASLRGFCTAESPTQTRAMAYGFNTRDPSSLPYLTTDLANFLLVRGPYAWLGHGWRGCSREYLFPDALNVDYGAGKFHDLPHLAPRCLLASCSPRSDRHRAPPSCLPV